MLHSEFEASLVYTMSSKASQNYIIIILSQKKKRKKKKAADIYLLSTNRWQADSTDLFLSLRVLPRGKMAQQIKIFEVQALQPRAHLKGKTPNFTKLPFDHNTSISYSPNNK